MTATLVDEFVTGEMLTVSLRSECLHLTGLRDGESNCMKAMITEIIYLGAHAKIIFSVSPGVEVKALMRADEMSLDLIPKSEHYLSFRSEDTHVFKASNWPLNVSTMIIPLKHHRLRAMVGSVEEKALQGGS